jgi:ankyrin repeat protein
VMQILLDSGRLDERSLTTIAIREADWHDYEGMQMALKHGANPNSMMHWDNSALHHAMRRDNGLETLTLLLDHGGDVTLKNRHGFSAAEIAAWRGRGDFLALLKERGIDAKLEGVHRLLAACALADDAAIHALHAKDGGQEWVQAAAGGAVLAQFAGNGNTEGVRRLLDLGVKPDALYEGDGYYGIAKNSTALHVAAWRGRPATTRLLVERGAPLNALDGEGRTALKLAVLACVDSYWKERRSPEWVMPLLEAGASIDGIEIPCGYDEVDELLFNVKNSEG